MMRCMKRRLLPLMIALLSLTAAPLSARADDTNAPKDYDGRLDDFGREVTLDSGGTALSYFLFAGLGVIAIGVLFKNARRTHLD
jgi:hypothetical protein